MFTYFGSYHHRTFLSSRVKWMLIYCSFRRLDFDFAGDPYAVARDEAVPPNKLN